VPILFTNECVKAIRHLKQHQLVKSKFVFAAGCGERPYKGWDSLQSIAAKIPGLKHPKLITPTRQRKFVATCMQLLDMNDAELTWLTNHMGHTKGVHFAWYRQEDSHIELTTVAKVLSALDGGQDLTNKKIDNVFNDGKLN